MYANINHFYKFYFKYLPLQKIYTLVFENVLNLYWTNVNKLKVPLTDICKLK